MVFGRIDLAINTEKDYLINQYRVHKFDEDHILITTDSGAWVVLNRWILPRFGIST